MPIKLFGGIRPFDRGSVWRDVFAGASAASINIPQVLGYARIAGVPVITGLYTLILPLVAFAVFGSSRHLVVAADSATAAIFSGSLSHMTEPGGARYMALVGVVTLLTAGLLLVARVFKLGFLADFLSRTVLVGFLTGVGLQVAIAMLGDMSGVAVSSRYSLVRAWEVMHGMRQPNLSTLALSTLVAGVILLGNRFTARVPFALIAGQRYRVATHGMWGAAVISSANLRDAIDTGLRYFELSYSFNRVQFSLEGRQARLEFEDGDNPEDLRAALVERDISGLATMHREMLGRPLPLMALSLRARRPAYALAFSVPRPMAVRKSAVTNGSTSFSCSNA